MSWPEQPIRSRFSGTPAGTLNGTKPNLTHAWEQHSGLEVNVGGSWVRLDEHLKSKQAAAPASSPAWGNSTTTTFRGPSGTAGRTYVPDQAPEDDWVARAIGVLVMVGIVCAIVAAAIYWTVRASIYASGMVWVLAVAACAPLCLRVFVQPAALEWHRRVARMVLWMSVAPVAALGISSCFDMLGNNFPLLPFRLGTVLAASALITAAAGTVTVWVVYPAQVKLNGSHPSCPRGHGFGLVALSPRITGGWFTNRAADFILAAAAGIGIYAGGIGGWCGTAVVMALIYTSCCDYFYRTGNLGTNRQKEESSHATHVV